MLLDFTHKILCVYCHGWQNILAVLGLWLIVSINLEITLTFLIYPTTLMNPYDSIDKFLCLLRNIHITLDYSVKVKSEFRLWIQLYYVKLLNSIRLWICILFSVFCANKVLSTTPGVFKILIKIKNFCTCKNI